MKRLRALPCLAVLALLSGAPLGCGDEEGEQVVDPDTVTEANVRAEITAEVQKRLSTAAEAPVGLEVSLLLHEVRQLEERDAPSDLAVIHGRWRTGGGESFALGQLYRHRSGDISWRWFDVRSDPDWLPFVVFDAPLTSDDVLAFLRYWDFEEDGQNGALVSGEVKAEAWRALFGEDPPVAYPEGTEPP